MGGVTLIDQLPPNADPDALFEAFSSWAEDQGITLYPAQEEALIEVVSGANVILSTRPARARASWRPAPTSPRWPRTR